MFFDASSDHEPQAIFHSLFAISYMLWQITKHYLSYIIIVFICSGQLILIELIRENKLMITHDIFNLVAMATGGTTTCNYNRMTYRSIVIRIRIM